jgi:hypothetical protein
VVDLPRALDGRERLVAAPADDQVVRVQPQPRAEARGQLVALAKVRFRACHVVLDFGQARAVRHDLQRRAASRAARALGGGPGPVGEAAIHAVLCREGGYRRSYSAVRRMLAGIRVFGDTTMTSGLGMAVLPSKTGSITPIIADPDMPVGDTAAEGLVSLR